MNSLIDGVVFQSYTTQSNVQKTGGASVNTMTSEKERKEDLLERYSGQSIWAEYESESKGAFFGAEETLSLSASGIKTYMTCPRQFYYRYLLRLPQVAAEAANLGSVIHRVMEIFNQQTSSKTQRETHTAGRLKAISETLFLFAEQPTAFQEAGFTEQDRISLESLSPLALADLKQRLLDSIDDLENKGYFGEYANFQTIHPEKALENIAIEGLDRCRFSGKLDALIQRQDGTWDILDYKTYQSAYSKGLSTCIQHFLETMTPLPEDPDLTHAERFAEKLNHSYPKDYQLPLYYLACQQDPQYRGQIREVAMQLFRPAFPDNPEQGSIRLALAAQEIESTKAHLIQDLNQYIVKPILEAECFEAAPAAGACSYCSYLFVCDQKQVDEEASES